MEALFPALWSANESIGRLGSVRQLEQSEFKASCHAVSFSREKDDGHQLLADDGTLIAYLFSKNPKTAKFDPEEPVIVAKYQSVAVDVLDIRSGKWISHPKILSALVPTAKKAEAARQSWVNTFNFIQENEKEKIVGLRLPQIGAIHALLAHWSTSTETCTIVMPTGTGKTESMLGALICAGCERLLVVVPTDALRTQIAAKFESLGIFKNPSCPVLKNSALCPVVGTLESRPLDVANVDAFFSKCNVVVTTSALLSGCSETVQQKIAESCSHLFIDEAHHAEAPTWKAFRHLFSEKSVVQFTATPFREDGRKLDGQYIFNYPLQKAQAENFFRPIRFRTVSEFDQKRGDAKIVEAAISELDQDASGKHIVMARVDGKARASEILELYQQQHKYSAVMLHSGLPVKEREEAKQKLFAGEARIVVCVDMLGEGFDLPELKIAAFHDIRKSLAVTLQLAGRFTRSRSDLGDPVFIANIAAKDAGV